MDNEQQNQSLSKKIQQIRKTHLLKFEIEDEKIFCYWKSEQDQIVDDLNFDLEKKKKSEIKKLFLKIPEATSIFKEDFETTIDWHVENEKNFNEMISQYVDTEGKDRKTLEEALKIKTREGMIYSMNKKIESAVIEIKDKTMNIFLLNSCIYEKKDVMRITKEILLTEINDILSKIESDSGSSIENIETEEIINQIADLHI